MLQVLSNDIRDNDDVTEVENKTKDLIATIASKWPDCKVILSLPPPRLDDERVALRSDIVNANLKSHFYEQEAVSVIEHRLLDPLSEDYNNDKLHLSLDGTKKLASNLRRAVVKALGLTGGKQGMMSNHAPNSHNRDNMLYGYRPHTSQYNQSRMRQGGPPGPWRRPNRPPRPQRWDSQDQGYNYGGQY